MARVPSSVRLVGSCEVKSRLQGPILPVLHTHSVSFLVVRCHHQISSSPNWCLEVGPVVSHKAPQQNGAPWLEVFFGDGLALVVHSSQLGNYYNELDKECCWRVGVHLAEIACSVSFLRRLYHQPPIVSNRVLNNAVSVVGAEDEPVRCQEGHLVLPPPDPGDLVAMKVADHTVNVSCPSQCHRLD